LAEIDPKTKPRISIFAPLRLVARFVEARLNAPADDRVVAAKTFSGFLDFERNLLHEQVFIILAARARQLAL
jgi:hypothetical protein